MRRFGAATVAFLVGALCAALLLMPPQRRNTGRVIAANVRAAARAAGFRDGSEPPVRCWGDSLTRGGGASPGHAYPDLVAYLFDREMENRGADGETSAQIEARMLARPSSTAPERAVVWAGRNDLDDGFAGTETNIADMVASLGPGSRFLVLGILNSDILRERRGGDRYYAIVALNERLRARYGSRYVPIREILVARAGSGAEDRAAVAADVVPPSLRSDPLHLDDRGQAVVAYAVEEAMRAEGW